MPIGIFKIRKPKSRFRNLRQWDTGVLEAIFNPEFVKIYVIKKPKIA
jgi:hypothetical protein